MFGNQLRTILLVQGVRKSAKFLELLRLNTVF